MDDTSKEYKELCKEIEKQSRALEELVKRNKDLRNKNNNEAISKTSNTN